MGLHFAYTYSYVCKHTYVCVYTCIQRERGRGRHPICALRMHKADNVKDTWPQRKPSLIHAAKTGQTDRETERPRDRRRDKETETDRRTDGRTDTQNIRGNMRAFRAAECLSTWLKHTLVADAKAHTFSINTWAPVFTRQSFSLDFANSRR